MENNKSFLFLLVLFLLRANNCFSMDATVSKRDSVGCKPYQKFTDITEEVYHKTLEKKYNVGHTWLRLFARKCKSMLADVLPFFNGPEITTQDIDLVRSFHTQDTSESKQSNASCEYEIRINSVTAVIRNKLTKKEYSYTHDRPIWAFAYSPDSKYIALSDCGGRIKVYDIKAEKEKCSYMQDNKAGYMIFTQDSRYVLSRAYGVVALFDIEQKQKVLSFRHPDSIKEVRFGLDSYIIMLTTIRHQVAFLKTSCEFFLHQKIWRVKKKQKKAAQKKFEALAAGTARGCLLSDVKIECNR